MKERNLEVLNPLLRKGGAHGKTPKAKRVADKRRLKKEFDM